MATALCKEPVLPTSVADKTWKEHCYGSHDNFTLSIKVPIDRDADIGFRFGIMPTSATFGNHHNNGVTCILSAGCTLFDGVFICEKSAAGALTRSLRDVNFGYGSVFVMRYSCTPRRSLSLSVDGGAPFLLPAKGCLSKA